nr:hypothetical protein [Tanacetum cinerariifolium]
MFLTHSDEALEIEKFKRSRENKIEFAYDYRNLNATYKTNFEDDYFRDIINPDFDKIDSPFQQTSSLKPYVPNVILEKIIIDLEDEVVNLLEKEKLNLKIIESLKSKNFESSEKKDKDEQVLLAEDQAWMESSSDSDQEINANMVFMAQIEKVLSDSEASSSSADEKISERVRTDNGTEFKNKTLAKFFDEVGVTQ